MRSEPLAVRHVVFGQSSYRSSRRVLRQRLLTVTPLLHLTIPHTYGVSYLIEYLICPTFAVPYEDAALYRGHYTLHLSARLWRQFLCGPAYTILAPSTLPGPIHFLLTTLQKCIMLDPIFGALLCCPPLLMGPPECHSEPCETARWLANSPTLRSEPFHLFSFVRTASQRQHTEVIDHCVVQLCNMETTPVLFTLFEKWHMKRSVHARRGMRPTPPGCTFSAPSTQCPLPSATFFFLVMDRCAEARCVPIHLRSPNASPEFEFRRMCRGFLPPLCARSRAFVGDCRRPTAAGQRELSLLRVPAFPPTRL